MEKIQENVHVFTLLCKFTNMKAQNMHVYM